jgi:uncharacterized protein YoxC
VPQHSLVVIAVVLLLPAALAGCGGSSNSSPEADWAQSFCGALGTWKSSVTDAANTLKNTGDLSKNKLQQAGDSISSANKKLADDLDGLGKPSGSAGSQAKDDVQQLTQELNADAAKVEDAMKGVSNVQELLAAVPQLSAAASSAASSVSSTITKLKSLDASKEWKQAFENSEACRSLKQGS